MRFVRILIPTAVAACLAQLLNPLVRVSPIDTYGMEQRYSAASLMVIIVGVALLKYLMIAILKRFNLERGRSVRERFVDVFVSVITISVMSIGLFLFSTIPCSPNFLILFTLLDAGAIAWIGTGVVKRGEPESGNKKVVPPLRLFITLVILAAGVPTILIGLVWSYERFPEARRKVNLIQNEFRPGGEYRLEDILGEVKFRQLTDFAVDEASGEILGLERHGRIFRVNADRTEKTLLVDFREEVGPVPDDELGAYSLALHPQYVKGSFEKGFAFYTSRPVGRPGANCLVELDFAAGVPGDVWAGRRVILKIPADSRSHNSGALEFDGDGFLFVGLGDRSRPDCARDLSGSLSGKILRIDPDKRGSERSFEPDRKPVGIESDYFVPRDNPFVGRPDVLSEIWASGIRNPFRIRWEPSLDALFVGDVGQLTWEELNLVRAGDDCGWPIFEGNERMATDPEIEAIASDYRFPIHVYRHNALERAVVGGCLIDGDAIPDLKGKLIFGDNFSGGIRALRGDPQEEGELLATAPDFNQSGISRIAPGMDGEIWISVMGPVVRDGGSIYRLVRGGSAGDGDRQERAPSEIFLAYCALCHGPAGDGKGAVAGDFPFEMPDFTSPEWQDQAADEILRKVIEQGGASVEKNPAMPGWGAVLSEPEIAELIDYIRAFGGGSPAIDQDRTPK